MELEWSDDLSVGNARIDSDHKDLILKTNNVVQAIDSRDISALTHAFDLLEKSLIAHFAYEKKIAYAIGFCFEQNESDHKNILEILNRIKEAVATMVSSNSKMTEDAVDYYSELLCDWLTNHVFNEDILMKPALKAYPYDYIPG